MAANFFVKVAATVFVSREAGKTSTIPRHRELNEFLARKICRDLDIPAP